MASLEVDDPRFDRLCEDVTPARRTRATITLVDDSAPLPNPGSPVPGTVWITAKKMDVLVLVVREFSAPEVPFHSEPDPKRDYLAIATEMLFADLQVIENRLERLGKEPSSRVPGTSSFADKRVLEKAKEVLERGEPLRKGSWQDLEKSVLQTYSFLSAKPWVVVINCAESHLAETPNWEDFAPGIPVVKVCAQCEVDLKGFSEKEREEFYHEWGVKTPPGRYLSRVIRDSAGLITFYTIEGDEARAWLVEKGTTAHQAAGVIHTDLMKGFIRAEVLPYHEFESLGSVQEATKEHKWQVHGKDYVLQDGDILRIRHKS
jgi:hypothetical protein